MTRSGKWTVLTAVVIVIAVVVVSLVVSWEPAAKILAAAVAILGLVAITIDGRNSVPSSNGAVPRRRGPTWLLSPNRTREKNSVKGGS